MGIKLDLSIQEVNVVLGSLAKQPYDLVSGIIAKIQTQGGPQAEAVAAEEKAAAEAEQTPAAE